jgi:hypothetical protein
MITYLGNALSASIHDEAWTRTTYLAQALLDLSRVPDHHALPTHLQRLAYQLRVCHPPTTHHHHPPPTHP